MGVMTLKQFKDQLNLTLGEHAQSGDDRLENWINRAYIEVALVHCHHEFEVLSTLTTAANDKDYIVSTGTGGIFAILSIADLTNNNRLTSVEMKEYHRLDRTQTGPPRQYARVSSTIYLWPTPDAIYNLEIISVNRPGFFTSDSTSGSLGLEYDHAIMLLAQRNAFLALPGMEEQATLRHQAAQNYLASIITPSTHEKGQIRGGLQVIHSYDDLTTQETDVPV